MRVLALGLLLLAFPSCVRVTWMREVQQEPLDPWTLLDIETTRPDLATCLERLGAPWDVFPSGLAETGLIYAWYDDDSVALSVSYSIERGVSASFSYTEEQLDIPALLLLFDEQENMVLARQGWLAEFAQRRRLDVQVTD